MPERPRPPVPIPQGDRERARDERRVRALENPLDVRARPDERFVRLEVRNPVHGTRYDVVLPAYPGREGGFCTCTDFARRGIGTCKHLESVWLWVGEHADDVVVPPEKPRTPLDWAPIDRALKAQARSQLADPLRYRLAGAALFE
ncbi:MAG: hypothetical protein L3J91_05360 [Thermoplasmata archaeon]|nr:hypothetical protein [Thermoplasmata archaeon]